MLFDKIGFEQEHFVYDTNEPNEVASLYRTGFPQDGCPFLLEVRGEADRVPLRALYNLLFQRKALELELMQKKSFEIAFPIYSVMLNKEQRQILRRQMTKEPMKQFRIGGGIKLPKSGEVTAGLHVHFSTDQSVSITTIGRKRETKNFPAPINIPRIVYLMDKAFEKEIKDAKRQTGLYEMKQWGFEYRSLPTTVNLEKVVDVTEKFRLEVK